MRLGFFFSALAVLSACGPPTTRAPRGGPLIDPIGPPPPLIQQLEVVALADPLYRLVPGYRARIGDRVDAASDRLAARLGLRLQLRAIRPWSKEVGSLDGALGQLRAAPMADADLVLLFTASPPPPRPRTRALAHADYLDGHAVLRSLGTFFRPDEEAWLRAAEVLAIEHVIGRIFGALPTCGPEVMAVRPTFLSRQRTAWQWAPENLALVRAHAALDLRRTPPLPPDVAQRISELLAQGRPDRCGAAAYEQRQALLTSVQAPAPTPALPPSVVAGREALAAGDHAAAFAACEPVAREDPSSPASRCAGMAAAGLGRGEAAIRYLRAWLDQTPEDEDAVLALAREVGRGGDDGAARALLARSVAANPDHLRARVNLGVALARLGDLAGAKAQWTAVLARAPDHEDAKALLAQLPP